MTLKKRLLISNIFMIAVPILASSLVGLACLQAVRISIEHGIRPGLHTVDEFPESCRKLDLIVEHILQEPPQSWEKQFHLLEDAYLEDNIAYRITSGSSILSQAGIISDDTEKLTEAISLLGGKGLVSDGHRSLYTNIITNKNGIYKLDLYGIEGKTSYAMLKMLLVFCTAVLFVTVIFFVWITDRFLINFVFKNIEVPLDILSGGVRELRDGNLSYRISYTRNDEFLPVCAGFNDMADHLKELIESVKQHEEDRK